MFFNVTNISSFSDINKTGTNCLTFEQDPEPFGKVRDSNIIEMCREMHIEVIQISSHTLYNLET